MLARRVHFSQATQILKAHAGVHLGSPTARMGTLSGRTSGFSLIELSIVILVIGVVLSIGLPNLVRARIRAQQNTCIQNLRLLNCVKEQWAIEARKKTGDAAFRSQITPYLKGSAYPTCPSRGIYVLNPVGRSPVCTKGAALGHTL